MNLTHTHSSLNLCVFVTVSQSITQLYIKISEEVGQQSSQPSAEETTDSPAAAMTLINPHLPLLSQYWLAALLDHAHLALPPQFSRQLPPAGGTFYSHNVADGVRPYFEQNWPSLLHAAAIWLKTTGLTEGDDGATQKEGVGLTPHPLMPEPLLSAPGARNTAPLLSDPKRERLYLVLGLAVQTLCAPATLDSFPTLLHCLRTLHRLLEADFVQSEISSDSKLATEILHLVHRLLLTCQSHDVHVIVMQIAGLVGQALGRKTEEEGERLGEVSSEEYERKPMFALMEVSACCLLRLVPDLRPDGGDTSGPVNKGTAREIQVAALAVSLLMAAFELCTLPESVDALPTVLHILLHTAKFAGLAQPPLLSSCLRSLHQLVSGLCFTHPAHGHALCHTLKSALASLLLGKSSGGLNPTPSSTSPRGDLSQTEREVKLMILTVLVKAPSPEICPNGSELFTAATNLFKDCLTSTDEKVWVSLFSM